MVMIARWFIIALAASLAACATPAPPQRVDDACVIFTDKPDWWRAANQAQSRWGLRPALLLTIVRQESSFTHDARPPRRPGFLFFPGERPSSAFGYAQALDGTWADYQRATGAAFAARDNFEHAADFIGWYTAQSRTRLSLGDGDYRAHYLAYHEGHSGYAQGSFRGKAWLADVASRVDRTARTYASQLAGCESRLNRGGWLPFF
jgi:hypothetical protein